MGRDSRAMHRLFTPILINTDIPENIRNDKKDEFCPTRLLKINTEQNKHLTRPKNLCPTTIVVFAIHNVYLSFYYSPHCALSGEIVYCLCN